MVIKSKRTGKKYLSVKEAESLQKAIEKMVRKKGLRIKTQYHPTYIEVPIVEHPRG